MEKDIFNINHNELTYGRGYVYSLQYHLVWCTKYRKKVLKDGIDIKCKKMLQDLAEEHKFQILAMEVMPDHIHLLVNCKPQFYISNMIKIMKGNLARRMFLVHPEVKVDICNSLLSAASEAPGSRWLLQWQRRLEIPARRCSRHWKGWGMATAQVCDLVERTDGGRIGERTGNQATWFASVKTDKYRRMKEGNTFCLQNKIQRIIQLMRRSRAQNTRK